MGIQDRDYYRDDEPTWWSGAANLRVTYGLMLLLGAVFVLQVLGSNPARGRPDVLLVQGCFDYESVLRGEVWRLVTPFLVHGRDALLLVALAIWAFYYFGRRVETALGSAGYLALLVSAALTLSLVKLAAATAAGFEAGLPTYGSGPILTAVLVAYVCLYPRERVVFIVEMHGWVLAAIVGTLEALGEFGGGFASSGKSAHLAGAAWGLAFVQLRRPVAQALRLDRLTSTAGVRRKSPLKLYPTPGDGTDRDVETEQAAREILGAYSRRATVEAPVTTVDEQFEAKLDRVLEKVSQSGRDSLTGDEQDILRRASELYKQRRNR